MAEKYQKKNNISQHKNYRKFRFQCPQEEGFPGAAPVMGICSATV
jgi:hypothetical protein